MIKVEPPAGDIMRHVGPMRNPGMGHIYLNLNRNKRSDRARPENAGGAARPCASSAPRADVFVSNVRPQAMARLGLGYEDIRAANPRIIYVARHRLRLGRALCRQAGL